MTERELVASPASLPYNRSMPSLNQRALELADAMAADADELGIAVLTIGCGTRVIDCGIRAPGSIEAGRRLAEVCMSGLATVLLVPTTGPAERIVQVQSHRPLAACMASQYAGWEIKAETYFAMGSGPMRAAAGREPLFDTIGHREQPEVCVGVLEAGKLPPEAVCLDIADKCGIEPHRLTLLVARTASAAGTVQIVARSVETAMHKLLELGFDIRRVEQAMGWAPLPPVADDDLTAIGWTNDAILYGGHAALSVRGDDASLEEIGPRVPSSASPDFGRPFAEVFARYNHDFYRIDPLLFSPAAIELFNLDTGRTLAYGEQADDVLAESFGKRQEK